MPLEVFCSQDHTGSKTYKKEEVPDTPAELGDNDIVGFVGGISFFL
jgi:hypothetical protein